MVAVALLGALVVSACGAGAGPGGSEPASDPAGANTPTSAAAASTPLTFRAQTVDGVAFDAADVADQPVLLWFWAPWCVVCRAEAPTIVDVAEELEGEVVVLGVAGQGRVEEMREFVADTGTERLTHVADTDGAIWRQFGVVAQPAYAFVSPDGQSEVFVGALDEDDLREFVGVGSP